MRLIITDRTKIIYSMYREGEVSVHRACCERTTQTYSLGGGGTIYPGYWPADVTTRSPRMGSRVFTRSILNKMYYLVANPEDRVSRDVAHFQMVYQFIVVHQSYTI